MMMMMMGSSVGFIFLFCHSPQLLGPWESRVYHCAASYILYVRRDIGRTYMALKEKWEKELKTEQHSQLVLHSHLLSDNDIYLKRKHNRITTAEFHSNRCTIKTISDVICKLVLANKVHFSIGLVLEQTVKFLIFYFQF